MTGRGHPGRGASRAHSEFVLDSFNRRGRGRPRKFPLATEPRMPSTDDVEDEEFRGVDEEEEYFQEQEDVEEQDVDLAGNRSELDKIKEIQQQKMLMVTPMAQKRVRGRPRRQSNSSQVLMNEEIEDELMLVDDQNLMESGPLEGPGPSETSKPPPLIVRGTRTRHFPRRINEYVSSTKKNVQDTVEPIITEEKDDNMHQLISNDSQIVHEEEVIEEEASREHPEEIDDYGQAKDIIGDDEPEEPEGPPPAPRHLVNKANSRGRPANPIPPHRRPVPKDLVPPGAPLLKRASAMRDPNPAKRKDTREHRQIHMDDGPPLLHPPAAPVAMAEDAPPSPLPLSEVPIAIEQVEVKQEAPEAVEEVIISGDGPPPIPQMLPQSPGVPVITTALENPLKKREREAGKDLPSEHFPKEKARHVSSRGLHPFIGEKSPLMTFDMGDQVMMEEIEEGQGSETVAQQRVLTLQGGSFIEDRIGRADLMEDEEMKMIKGVQTQQYIVEENGVNVVYEMDPNDVIGTEEQVVMEQADTVVQEEQYVIEEHQLQNEMHKEGNIEDDDDDDDLPPQLVPEVIPDDVGDEGSDQEKDMAVEEDIHFDDLSMMQEGEYINLHSPGGQSHIIRVARDEQGNNIFYDENNQLLELMTETGEPVTSVGELGHRVEIGGQVQQVDVKKQEQEDRQEGDVQNSIDRANIEFMNSCSFLDTNHICCGLCGEIVAYDKLISEHLPAAHPETQGVGVEFEEVPYNSWLKTRLKQESKMMENGFRHYDDHDGAGFGGAVRLYSKGLRQLRKVSQIRVNVNEMSLAQLEHALNKKLVEKMGRKVPVSLVDRLHARCDICQAVVSLNKKFEVIHLVRHFNAWHPAEHRCSQEWKDAAAVTTSNSRRPLSLHDFAVVSTETDLNNLQCIWCGMMMDRAALGMHFTEVHHQQVIVPNCSLCLQEMVMTARLMEKYGEDFGISLPDEFHLLSSKLNAKYSSEKSMDKAIDKYLKRVSKAGAGHEQDEEDGQEDQESICTTNSQQSFGRRNRLKRKFVKPCFRQICPTNSEFFEAKSACEWKCRLCNRNVFGAVISAGAIKHFKEFHPVECERMQFELVKARLERIGDGSMEFVHPQLVECLICSLTYALHKPFNICRAIRHLRLKHPEVMPETAGKPISGAEIIESTEIQPKPIVKQEPIRFAEVITDPIELEKFRKENFDQQFDKVQVVYGIKKNNEAAYILLMDNETMDRKTALEMAEKMRADEEVIEQTRFDQLVPEEEERQVVRMQQHEPQYETVVAEPSGSQIYEAKPSLEMAFPEQIIEGVGEEIEMVEAQDGDFMQTYDANNPDHVLIEENDLLTDGNYEMIQEGEYQEIEEDNRTVRYLTEDEIREAQARGEILEFEEEFVEAEYAVDQQ